MPPRDRDGVFHRDEQMLRDATITFENGRRLEVPEIRAMSNELDEPNEIPITSIGAQEANFSMEGTINLDTMQDAIDEAMRRQREAELQTLAATINRMSASTRDALDSVSYLAKAFAGAYDTSFIESLNAAWEKMGDDFELADEEEYVATDPISFDELMGGGFNDN